MSKILSQTFVEELQGIRKTCFITQSMYIHVIALGKWSPGAEVKRNRHKIVTQGQAGGAAGWAILNEKIFITIS